MRWSIPIRRKRSKRASSNWWKAGESRQRHGGILEILGHLEMEGVAFKITVS